MLIICVHVNIASESREFIPHDYQSTRVYHAGTILGLVSRLVSLTGTWLKRHHAFLCLVVVWLYAGFWATMPLMGWGNYAPEPFGTSCTLDWRLAQASVSGQTFVMSILFFCLVLPTGIIVYSYVMIIYKVKSSAKEISNFDAQIRNSHSLEMKLTKVGERTFYVHCEVQCSATFGDFDNKQQHQMLAF